MEIDEMLKLEILRLRATKSQNGIIAGNTVDDESFFDELEAGLHE